MFKYLLLFFSLCIAIFAEPIQALPQSITVDEAKASLGKSLFFDPILSQDGTISCAHCHKLEEGGDDNLKFSFGVKGQEGTINSPTVFNSVYNFRQFWDGRASDLQDQAAGPIENPVEMANTFKNLIPILEKSVYKKRFDALYKEGITKNSITDAIAEYEKTLITPNAPFDLYLRGNEDAISLDQKEGYQLFKSKGCITCHHGINIGGNLYNKFGILQDAQSKNLGRYNVTHNERDKYYFKVPSLRNIAKTGPYFHDGRTDNLYDAVVIMAKHQLGRKISEDEIKKIVLFLESLNGDTPPQVKP
ncbi:MAG: cytochrome-c peroxidase [Campylobacterota bacterium]|nr:cytochrome-c peroxidase [Campylobacterota bacterium]